MMKSVNTSSKRYSILLFLFGGLVITVLFLLLAIPVFADSFVSEDNIYFFSQHGDNDPACDMILLESNGHYALVDTSNNTFDTITDEDGIIYHLKEEDGLCDHTNNGVTNAKYMIDVLGVEHLDFVIGTHSHSDHIGGVSEIASLEYKGVKLIDENTIYIYKEYKPTSVIDDNDWLNNLFYSLALSSVTAAGAETLNISQGYYGPDIENGLVLDYTEQLKSLEAIDGIDEAFYHPGKANDAYDDVIEFTFGHYTIDLYNLFSTPTYMNENVNSICTLIRKGSQSILLLSDINDEQQVSEILAYHISEDIGGARITLLKDAHHGAPRGSNTKSEADFYRPVFDVSTKCWDTTCFVNNFANFKYYCEMKYGTVFYATGDADKALVAHVLDDNTIIEQVSGNYELKLLTPQVNDRVPIDGWHIWDDEYNGNNYNRGTEYWTYFQEGKVLTDWQVINERQYYFDSQGFLKTGWLRLGIDWYYIDYNKGMQTGWINGNGTWDKWYYMDPETGKMAIGWKRINGKWYYLEPTGAMVTGWLKSKGQFYYFDTSGTMLTGWQKINGNWYFLNSSGVMLTDWQYLNNHWYYLSPSGAMLTSWQKINGNWYLLDSDGVMLTGWQNSGNLWYFLKADGRMAYNEWFNGYWFNNNGSWTYKAKGVWKKDSHGWWFGDSAGWYARATSVTIDEKKYDFDPSGYIYSEK